MSRAWYILQTYSQYEKKVETALRGLIDDENYNDLIFDVYVPVEEVEQQRKNKKIIREKKIWPGYVLVELDLETTQWRALVGKVKQIGGVSNFIGTLGNNKPQPLAQEEARRILNLSKNKVLLKKSFVEFHEGELVKIISGSLNSFEGKIETIDYEKEKLKIAVQIFGRITPVEVDFAQVEKI